MNNEMRREARNKVNGSERPRDRKTGSKPIERTKHYT